jgi:glycosyltransferase involved in cell wall biosynthesis
LLEASAAGVPIVAYDEGGTAEIVANRETGLLARPGDLSSLAEALLRLAKDADLRIAFGRAARRRVATAFNPGDAGRTFSRVLREAAIGAKSASAPEVQP